MKKILSLCGFVLMAQEATAQQYVPRLANRTGSNHAEPCANLSHFYRTDTNKVMCCENAVWAECGSVPANTVDHNGSCLAGYVPYMTDANTVGCEAALTYNADTNTLDVDILTADRVALSSTLTSDVQMMSISPTWNSGGTTFEGMVMNVTDTASAAGSLFADFQSSGDTKLSIAKNGTVTTEGDYMPEATATYEYTPITFLMDPNPNEYQINWPQGSVTVIPADDRPLVFIGSFSNGGPLKVYRCNDSACSGVGTVATLVANGMYAAEGYQSVAAGLIPSSGIPFFVAIDSNLDVLVGVCTTTACTAANTNVVASGSFYKVALAFRESDDAALIAFQSDWPSAAATFSLTCTDPGAATPCSNTSSPAELPYGGNAGVSAAWVSSLPFIAYTSNDFLKLATVACADDECSSTDAGPTYIATKHANSYAYLPSVAVDPIDGFASIVYSGGSTTPFFVSCGDASCSSLDQTGVQISVTSGVGNSNINSLYFFGVKPLIVSADKQGIAAVHFCSSGSCTVVESSTTFFTYGGVYQRYAGSNAAISSTGDLWTVMAIQSTNGTGNPYLSKLPLTNPSVNGTELGSNSKRISSVYVEAGIEAGSVTLRGTTAPWDGVLYFEGATDDSYETILKVVNPTADRTITFPNASGTVALTSQLGGGGGITNSAGANVVMKSDGTDAIASNITDDGTTVTVTGSLSVGTFINLDPQGTARGSTACDASGEEGDTYLRRVSTTVSCLCVCVQNGASYEWAAISLLGACVASTDC